MMATLADLLTPYLILSANMIPLSNSMAALFALTYGNDAYVCYLILILKDSYIYQLYIYIYIIHIIN